MRRSKPQRPRVESLESRTLLTVHFVIDPLQNVQAISRLIYGINYGANTTGLNPTFERLGGNRWTAYNWENNASNAGSDYIFQNDDYLGGGSTPGGAVIPFLQDALNNNAAALLTIPINGYVAADINGGGDVHNSGANYLQTRFKQELPTKGSAFTLTPNVNDAYVYQDEFANWVKTNYPYGQTDPNHPIMYSLDNEPDLWASTHAEVHPSAVTYAELVQKSISYASAIKAVVPGSQIFGPANYGWYGYTTLQGAPDAAGRDFQDFYLQQFAQASQTAGHRLLDSLDVHWYPEATGGGVRITGSDVTAAVVAARLQAPRSLWDPTYTETSWITQYSTLGPIDLIPLLKQKISQNYPGTKLSMSEYNYGGGTDISGGIAQADVLGIFGKQGVYAASEWPLLSSEPFIGGAFKMFRNYDGLNSTFGDTSIQATNDSVANSSVYASIDSTNPNVMVVVAINKTASALPTTMQLNSVPAGAIASAYQLTSASANPQSVGNSTITNPAAFAYSMPAYSVTTFRINLSVSAKVIGTTLQVTGDASDNQVSLRLNPTDSTQTQVLAGSTVLGNYPRASFNTIAVQLNGGNDTLTLDNSNGSTVPSGGITYDGGVGSNRFIGPAAANSWAITGVNSGTLNLSTSFTNVQNLQGNTGADTFRFTTLGSIAQSLDGGAGIDTLDYSALTHRVVVSLAKNAATGVNNLASGSIANLEIAIGSGASSNLLAGPSATTTWNLTGPNAGNCSLGSGIFTFSAFQNLAGSTGADTFHVNSGASLAGYVDGGAGSNTLDYSGFVLRIVVSLATNAASGFNSLSNNGIANFQTIVGSAAPNNLISGSNHDNFWNLTGTNAGNVRPSSYGTVTFSGFGSLAGGLGKDAFKIGPAANFMGTLDGSAGLNTLDYSAYVGRVVVNLASYAATGFRNLLGSSVFGFQNFVGNSTSTNLLSGPTNDALWQITANNAGTINSSFTFVGFPNLAGNSRNDDFIFSPGTSLAGTLEGGTGLNTIDASAWSTAVTINLTSGNASLLSKVYHVQNVLGGAGNDILTGGSSGGILVGNAGSDNLLGGTGRSILIGGVGSDSITGGPNGDLLIQGTTSYDNNLTALLAILSQWQSSNTYANRLNNLRVGINDLVWGTTVHDDATSNLLTGYASSPLANELDWFFANQSVGHDTIHAMLAGDVVN